MLEDLENQEEETLNQYNEIWEQWDGRKIAKITLLLDILTCWTLVLVNIDWWIRLFFILFLYIPLLYYFIMIPWNLSVYQSKYCYCSNYKKIVQTFDNAINEYMTSRNPLNKYSMLRYYRYASLICVFGRVWWSFTYYDTLVPSNSILYLLLYLIVSIQPILQSIFIWQFCNNIAKNYIERGLTTQSES